MGAAWGAEGEQEGDSRLHKGDGSAEWQGPRPSRADVRQCCCQSLPVDRLPGSASRLEEAHM